MDRRGFLKALGGVIGGIAVAEAIPLGRVWSFPSEIKVARGFEITKDYYSIEWPVVTREWQFGTYVNDTLEKNGLGFNFYDLRAPLLKTWPASTPFRSAA